MLSAKSRNTSGGKYRFTSAEFVLNNNNAKYLAGIAQCSLTRIKDQESKGSIVFGQALNLVPEKEIKSTLGELHPPKMRKMRLSVKSK